MPYAQLPMSLRVLTVLLLFAGLAAGGRAEAAVGAVDEDLSGVEQRLTDLDASVAQLRGRYVRTLELRAEREFRSRFEQALFLYNDGDFVHASIIFTDLLDYPDVERRSEYSDVLWYLGDSFARNKNYISAREWLEKVVAFGQSTPHFRDALVRLIEISVELGRFQEAETYYNTLSRVEGPAGYELIQYAYAKSLHKKGRLDQALRAFRQVPVNGAQRPEADYFIGVILVQKNQLEEALAIFDELSKLDADSERRADLRELAMLASARIRFELGRYEEALSLYRQIPVDSKFFDQAYYEICWIHIKQKKYAEAANTLDIMLLALPDSVYAPNSQVLKGNIRLWESRWDDAQYSFQTVINKYANVVDTMDELLVQTTGQRAEEIQTRLLSQESTLPSVVMSWLEQEEDVAEVLAMKENLKGGEEDAEESARIVDSLKLHLSQESKANLFPQLKEGRERGLAVKTELTEVRGRLVSLSNDLVGDRITDAQRERLVKVQARRRELEELFATIPKTVQARHERRQRQVARLDELDKQLYALTLQLKGLDEVLAEVAARHEKQTGDPNMSADYLAKAKAEIRAERDDLKGMLRYVEGVQRDVSRAIERTKIGDESADRDERIQRELERVQAEEKTLLAAMRNAMGSDELTLFERIELAKQHSDRLNQDVEVFFLDLENMVGDRVQAFVRKVEKEERDLAIYMKDLRVYQDDSEKLAAEIAYNNLQSVRDRFYDIVLKANVGLVDIAWEKRQTIKDKIDGILDQRSDEKEQLNVSFRELRGE